MRHPLGLEEIEESQELSRSPAAFGDCLDARRNLKRLGLGEPEKTRRQPPPFSRAGASASGGKLFMNWQEVAAALSRRDDIAEQGDFLAGHVDARRMRFAVVAPQPRPRRTSDLALRWRRRLETVRQDGGKPLLFLVYAGRSCVAVTRLLAFTVHAIWPEGGAGQARPSHIGLIYARPPAGYCQPMMSDSVRRAAAG